MAAVHRCVERGGRPGWPDPRPREAVPVIAGQPLRYECGGGVGLYGNVQRSSVWTIYEGTAHNATLQPRPIAIAWF